MTSSPSAAGKTADEVWTALGINKSDVHQIQTDPEINRSVGYPAALEEELAAVFPEEEQRLADSANIAESIATPVEVALDPSARLIPHAVKSVAENYRRLRTKILQLQEEKGFRSLVVTSATPQEGKTVTVLNLGLSLATLPSFKVLVMDGDLRRGSLGNWLGVNAQCPGLSNLIEGTVQLDEVILKSDRIPIHVITRGNTQVPDLHSSELSEHFQRLNELYDLVLVDSPPVNLIADVQLLAASCDAVLLVARAFSTSKKDFERAVRELQRFKVIGTVLNAGGSQDYYRYAGDY